MFDGSYRSKPRSVNLGTNRNRPTSTSNNNNNNAIGGNSSINRKRNNNSSSGAASLSASSVAAQTSLHRNTTYNNNNNSNRDSILNEAHRLRMERYQKLQYNKAAIRIQQLVRGKQLRKRLVQLLYHRIIGDDTSSTPTISSSNTYAISSGVSSFGMIVETSDTNTDIATDIKMTTMAGGDDPLIVRSETLSNGTLPPPSHQQRPDMTMLLNIYLRLQQQSPDNRKELNSNIHQQPISKLLHQYSIHIQEHYHAQESSSLSKRAILDGIIGIMNKALSDICDNDNKVDFVLQVRPNTYHILKSMLQLIPTLYAHQQSKLSSSSSAAAAVSTADIIIVMSHIMQLHQYPTNKGKIRQQEEQLQSAMSKGSSTTILQMMIGTLTFMIDVGGRKRETEKIDSRKLSNTDEITLFNTDDVSDSVMRKFLMCCVAIFIVNQPKMIDWCRPVLGAVLLIYDSFHIDILCDVESSILSKFRQHVSGIMKVLRPIPIRPSPSIGNTTTNIGSNSNLKEMEGDDSKNEHFVAQVVSQLVCHYRMPLLLVLSRAMRDEPNEVQNDEYFGSANISSAQEPNRTRTQKEILVLSLCIQFLKYLLLDTNLSNDSTTTSITSNAFQQKADPTWNDSSSHFLLWMIQRAVRGDVSPKEEQHSIDVNQSVVVDIIDDGAIYNDEEMDQHVLGDTYANHQEPNNATFASSVGSSRAAAVVSSSSSNPAHRRLTKNDLLTLPKLDKKFTDIVKNIDAAFTTSVSKMKNSIDTLQILVQQICDPNAWLQWGNLLLSTVEDMDDDFYTTNDDMEYKIILRHGQDDYINLLVIFLQATTSLRTQQNALSSPFLKVLPYSSVYLSNLWKYVLRQIQITTFLERNTTKNPFLAPQSFLIYDTVLEGFYRSMSLFSDFFVHHLIAVNDEQFITLYTNLRPAAIGRTEQTIRVDEVIVHMRTVLNELYWTKPVFASDLKIILSSGLFHCLRLNATNVVPLIAMANENCTPYVRARFLLTGTKLYNALYERWCRLVTYAPFCDESIWWFPAIQSFTMVDNLITRDEDIESTTAERIAFTQQRQRDVINRSSSDFNDDPMDVDESSDDDENERNRPTSIDEESDRLAAAFSDPKMARLLGSIPQVLPFDRRVKMFDTLIRIDKLQSQDEGSDIQQILNAMIRGENGETGIPGRKSVKIRRDELYSDSMEQLNLLGPKLKGRVRVSFTNQVGTDEAGIDGGGVFKEFIDDLIKDAFSVGETTAKQNLFSATPYQTLTVNTELLNNPTLLPHYEFLGRVLGKAVYESILVEAQFCLPFLNQILGRTNTIEDLKNLDSEYYTNLRKLLTMSKSDIESLCLTFELTFATKSTVTSIELLPNGGNISLTKSNVVQYVLLVSHHRLNVLTFHQTRAFLRGFRDLIPASWVRLFSAHELQKVISGDDSIQGIDVPSLKKVMQYAAGYHPSQLVIEWFWEIIEEMTVDQQRKFLKFMTSCSRQPLLGFGSLEPAPCIQQIRLPESLFASNDDEVIMKKAPLPTSSTCMNLFKLPNYNSKEIMRRKMLAAIESGTGFELT